MCFFVALSHDRAFVPSNDARQIINRDDQEDAYRFNAGDRENIDIGLPVREAGHSQERDHSAVIGVNTRTGASRQM